MGSDAFIRKTRRRGTVMIQAKGIGGTIEFDGATIKIVRGAMSPVGKGTKAIPLQAIGSIQRKPATRLMNGWIEFGLMGGNELRARPGFEQAQQLKNENAMVFKFKQNAEFETLQEAVEQALARRDVR